MRIKGRLSPNELRRIELARPSLAALAFSHASEHRVSVRTALREIQRAAAVNQCDGIGDGTLPATRTPIIPAYRTRSAGGSLLIQFRCPACKKVHTHGLPALDEPPLQHRGSHCEHEHGRGRGYRLLVVGWKVGDDLPTCSAAEIDALNAVVSEAPR